MGGQGKPVVPPAKPTEPPVNVIPNFKDMDKNITTDSSKGLQKMFEGDFDEAYRNFSTNSKLKGTDGRDRINPEAYYGLGRILYEGLGQERNVEKGLLALRSAAKAGSVEAIEYLKRINK